MPSYPGLPGGRRRRRHIDLSVFAAALVLVAATAAKHRSSRPSATADSVGVVAAVTCEPFAGPVPDEPPRLRSAVGIDLRSTDLEHPRDDSVRVCVLVDSNGTVRDAVALTNGRRVDPLTPAALESARWWLFEPARLAGRAVPARVIVRVPVHVPVDVDPPAPDVLAMAAGAEARGDVPGAIDDWTGALARVGQHPALQDEWAIRARVIGLASRLATPPAVPMLNESRARSTHNLILRNIDRASNADYARALDDVLRDAPWYADAYRWRASARAASGQRDGAVRDVLCYRLAARDSAGRALADRALIALAARDTIAALTMLKQ